jgi:hypothetical protein
VSDDVLTEMHIQAACGVDEKLALRQTHPAFRQMAAVYQKMRSNPPGGAAPLWLDKEVVPLVVALNAMKGVVTVESCCGHGKDPFYIWFYAESVDTVRPLFELVSTRRGWRIIFQDYIFCLKGPKGERAYRESEQLAAAIVRGKEA